MPKHRRSVAKPRRLPKSVRRTHLPFAHLDNFEKKAIAEFKRVLDHALRLIAYEVRKAKADPADRVIEGRLAHSTPAPLRKSHDAMAIPCFQARFDCGAPAEVQGQLKPATIEQLAAVMPARDGVVYLAPDFARIPLEEATLEWTQDIIPTTKINGWVQFKLKDIKNVLLGKKREVVRLLKHEDGYTVLTGVATAFAAAVLKVPAIEALVSDAPSQSFVYADNKVRSSFGEVAQVAESIIADEPYTLSLEFESLAEKARELDKDTFVSLYTGQVLPEEAVLQQRAEEEDILRSKAWVRLFRKEQEADTPKDTIPDVIQNNPTWKYVEARAERAMQAYVAKTTQIEPLREWFFLQLETLDELGIPVLTGEVLWNEARKGRGMREAS